MLEDSRWFPCWSDLRRVRRRNAIKTCNQARYDAISKPFDLQCTDSAACVEVLACNGVTIEESDIMFALEVPLQPLDNPEQWFWKKALINMWQFLKTLREDQLQHQESHKASKPIMPATKRTKQELQSSRTKYYIHNYKSNTLSRNPSSSLLEYQSGTGMDKLSQARHAARSIIDPEKTEHSYSPYKLKDLEVMLLYWMSL